MYGNPRRTNEFAQIFSTRDPVPIISLFSTLNWRETGISFTKAQFDESCLFINEFSLKGKGAIKVHLKCDEPEIYGTVASCLKGVINAGEKHRRIAMSRSPDQT